MKKRTIGVIGLGAIGSRHARNLQRLGCNVVSYDPKKGHGPEDYAKALDCDAVVIASPTDKHAEHLAACATKGVPCFVEKPVADWQIDVNAVMVGYNLRFHSCVLKAKAWIDAEFLGSPIWANLVCAEYKADAKDHVVLNWSHEIDLALHLLGPAIVNTSSANNMLADIILRHTGECQSTIHLDYYTRPDIRQTIIVGSKATIILDLLQRHAWLRSAEGTIIDAFTGTDTFDDNYYDEMETFLARLDGKETVGCTGEEGLKALEICLSAIGKSNDASR